MHTRASPSPCGISQINTQIILASSTITLITLLFWPTVWSMVGIWSSSETFTHGFFVLPVFIWLAWQCRNTYALIPATPDLLALLPLTISGALWLLSKLAGIQVGEHLAFVLILVFSLWAILGRDITRMLKFPLSFLFFLAPIGEELVPLLMELTADMTVWAIRNTGVPIYREGLFFSLPTGNWSVVEACSGIRYLISSVALGYLYAYLSFTSLRLRLAFIAIAFVVPIVANSVRAYLIVMLGHLTSNKLATGVDHLVYGWLFFGVVMFALFSIGGWMRQYDAVVDSGTQANQDQQISVIPNRNTTQFFSRATAIATTLFVIAAWPIWAATINVRYVPTTDSKEVGQQLLPKSPLAAELASNSGSVLTTWQPKNSGHDQKLEAYFMNGDVPVVRAVAFVYEHQRQGKEMISSRNVLVKSLNDSWRLAYSKTRSIELDLGEFMDIKESQLISKDRQLTVWQWYRIGDSVTSNASIAKLLEAKDRLLLRKSLSVNYIILVENNNESALRSTLNKITRSQFTAQSR